MWVWALRGSRHFEQTAYSMQLHWPHRGELIIVSLEAANQDKGMHQMRTVPKIRTEQMYRRILQMFSYEDKKSAIELYYNLRQEGRPTDQRARLSRQAHLCTIGSKTTRCQALSQKTAAARVYTPKSKSALWWCDAPLIVKSF